MYTIKHIKHSDINFKKWNDCVLSSEFPFVFAQSFYLDATSPDWDALVIGDYESIFPLTHKTKYGLSYLPQPSFTSQLGAYGKVNDEIEFLFYDYIKKNFKLIEIELNAANHLNTKETSDKKTYVINYEEGFVFNQNTKRNLKKAQENQLVVQQVNSDDILNLSKKYITPFLVSELKLSKNTSHIFDNLLKSALENNQLVSFMTLAPNKEVRALAHFVFNNKHAFYLKGTNFDKTDNSGSMHLVMERAINYFKDKCELFDFGGGSSTGLGNFYSGLGGKPLVYRFLKINQLPFYIKVFKK